MRIGTRGSSLALAQARLVADALIEAGWPVELVTIRTAGDDGPPDLTWGEGAFVTAIEAALRGGHIDLAVHSAKDLPTDEPDDLRLGAILPRADPRDAIVTREPGTSLSTLPSGGRIGTDSPRRSGFLSRLRPDLVLHPLHGNVDRRLARLDDGETDALVLAVAGLARLGRLDRVSETLDPGQVPPAPGQGAIAVQIRRGDRRAASAAARLDDAPTRQAITAERAFLHAMGGGCRSPIGALAELRGGRLALQGGVVRPDGASARFGGVEGDPAAAQHLGMALARILGVRAGDRQPSVIVTREVTRSGPLMAALTTAGLRPLSVPTIRCRPLAPGGTVDGAAAIAATFERVVITSAAGADAFLAACRRTGGDPRAIRWAAVGDATAGSLRAVGAETVWVAPEPSAASLAEHVPLRRGRSVLVVGGDRSGPEPAATLRARGAEVETICAYRTEEGPASSAPRLRLALAEGTAAAIVFTSGSTVRGLVRLAGTHLHDLRMVPAVCIGEATASEARRHGFERVVVAEPDPAALAAAAAKAVGAAC